MCQVNNAFLNSILPETGLFDLPFIFRDNDHMHHVVRGPIGQAVYGRLEQKTGIRIMMAGIADGPRSVYNRVRPIHTPTDLKGLKIRVMESPLQVATFKALGALPVPMAFPAIYMAMKQGVIDGAETPPAGLADQKASEVAKYYSLTQHFSSPSSVAVNAKWFDGLPPQYQSATKEAMAEALAWYDALYVEETRKGLELAKAQGMEVNAVDNPAAFHDAVKPVYEEYAPRVGGMQAIQAVLDTK
jgi:tripartite ATP-independent transporter DctP family solute receptor